VKVLVLTRSTGEGHNHVAQALRDAFAARGHDCDVLDALRVADAGVELVDPGVSEHRATPAQPDVASRLYGWAALKMPALFGAAYNLGDVYSRTRVPSPIRFHNSRFAEATQAYIELHRYEVIVATHLFPQATLSTIRHRHPSAVRFYGVLTDYTCSPFFTEPRLDGYFIPHPDMMAECVRRGLPRDWTYAVGLPISTDFRPRESSAPARAELELAVDRPLTLVMSGGVGSLFIGEACDQLLAYGGQRTQVVVLTGRREDLYAAITKRYWFDARVTVVPFTDRVADYMAAADVLVTKPGAVTTTEAAAMRVPLVHTGAIPGGETKNAAFFADRGMSVYAQDPREAARLAQWLSEDPAKVARMRACQAEHLITDGAERIVTTIEDRTL